MSERWENQQEAYEFALRHDSTMLDMDMGTGKTRTTIDVIFERMRRGQVHKVLVVCPKAVLDVWPRELKKHAGDQMYKVWGRNPKKNVSDSAHEMEEAMSGALPGGVKFAVVNYDIVWKWPFSNKVEKAGFDMVVLDESHRAKAAGSKVSKYMALLGKRVKYKMCLSGTPMANSTLDVYGQYRFLDPSIFGTNHNVFLQQYAVMGGPDRQFIVGVKNQKELHEKFASIAYSCKMSDIAERIKLPAQLPDSTVMVHLPARDLATSNKLSKKFISECGSTGIVTAKNVLVKILRLQQISSGFCEVQDDPSMPARVEELNTVKEDALADLLQDVDPLEPVVVFCVFTHDLDAVHRAGERQHRMVYELSGRKNELDLWRNTSATGPVLAVQIQAGAEGIDMTAAHRAVYMSLPHSLAMYEQSRARLYRPGQQHPVVFSHIIASDTVDESMYDSLQRKQDIIESVKMGTFDFGYMDGKKHVDRVEFSVF